MKFLFLLLALLSVNAQAHTDEQIDLGPTAPSETLFLGTIDGKSAFERTKAVLDYYGVPAEDADPTYLNGMGPHYNAQQLLARQAVLDPKKSFQRFFSLSGLDLQVFQDFDSKEIPDRSFDLGSEPRETTLRDRILAAKANPPATQLKGLRIALDPGHMGSTAWDIRTGKRVVRGKLILSEGMLNLEICHLLKAEFEKLGASVLITHDAPGAVSKLPYETFDLKPYAREELRYVSLESWFQSLLATAPPGRALYTAFENSPKVKRIFSGNMRSEYFAKRADLYARVEMMEQFKPDITIYVHHDTTDTTKSPDMTRLYLPGGMDPTEFADRTSRKHFLNHWLDKDAWELSMQLARKNLQSINRTMGIPLAQYDGTSGVKVESGIFARNLMVPRKMRNTVTVYHELYFYDRAAEFTRLTTNKYSMIIAGTNYPYSERLRSSVIALRDGVTGFIKTAQ